MDRRKKIGEKVDMANVLITGGSRGIGASCVEEFCKQGDRVAFFYRADKESAKALAERTGAIPMQVDVTDSEAVLKAVEEVVRLFGGIDVLVSNAGVSQIKLFTEITDEDWKRMIDTNLSGAFFVARAVAKHMIAEHKGSIVFIGSMWGKTGASCEVHYSASKAALRGMTQALAKELGRSGITVNCVEPGVIDTDMNRMLDDETRAALCEETPLYRIGLPREVATTVRFLASEDAAFITGQILGVDGGFAI